MGHCSVSHPGLQRSKVGCDGKKATEIMLLCLQENFVMSLALGVPRCVSNKQNSVQACKR